jgi:hypothetical protein
MRNTRHGFVSSLALALGLMLSGSSARAESDAKDLSELRREFREARSETARPQDSRSIERREARSERREDRRHEGLELHRADSWIRIRRNS